MALLSAARGSENKTVVASPSAATPLRSPGNGTEQRRDTDRGPTGCRALDHRTPVDQDGDPGLSRRTPNADLSGGLRSQDAAL